MMMCSLLWTYEPLTDEEILIYWNSLTHEQKIEEIRKLDLLEHIPIQIDDFKYLALLTVDNELIIYPEDNIIEGNHAYLVYEIEIPTFYIENFTIPVKKKYILAGVIGGGCSLLGTVITGEKERWKFILSGCIGLSIGITAEYLFR